MWLCYLIGHKFKYTNGGWLTDVMYYHMSSFCLRCGKPVKKEVSDE